MTPTGTPTGLEAYLDVEERESKKVGKGTLRLLIKEILKHRLPFAGGMVLIFTGTSAVLLEPRLFGYAIDDGIIPKNWSHLLFLTYLFFGAVLVRVLSSIGQSYLFEVLGQNVTQDLRVKLFSHLQRQPVSVFDLNPAGRLMTRVTNDVASLGEMFSAGFVSMVSNFLTILGILVWMLILNVRLGLIALSVFPIMLIASIFFSHRLTLSYRDARSKLSALNAFLAENILGMRVVLLFNRVSKQLEKFGRLNQWYADAQISTVRVFALFQPTITLAAGLSVALVIWVGGGMAIDGYLKVGVLVTYFSYSISLFQPVRELADKWNIFLSGMASAERIYSILNWKVEIDEVQSKKQALPIAGLRGQIAFENVWFAYKGEHWVLRDFSITIPAGARVGVVGHTGAGKTTLISLLLRFYEPQKGRILIDGKDIREYDRRSLRASIGIVQQDVFVFSGSLADNISFFGSRAIPQNTPLPEALKNRDELIQERGSNLSMGERQILAFERALAANPRIWILDEATANMDSQSETRLQEVLNVSSQGCTSILIAHRLATVKNADQILVLHKGCLIEHGSHAELLKLNGLYARLDRFQQIADPSVNP